ncbi:MAG: hypothetical protein AB1451_13365 [Nitrospirota bacterium]
MRLIGSGVSAVLAVVAVLAIASGCEHAEKIRQFTYPPDFKYIETSDVHSKMWTLARDSRALKTLLAGNGALKPEQHEEVIHLLREMETAAAQLDPPGQRTNHPLLDRNIEAFRRDIGLALRAADQDPPNYFLAGSVAGSCSYCHEGQQ